MTQTAQLAVDEASRQHQRYNAVLTDFRRLHDDLAIIRVLPDDGPLQFRAGQFTVLGLGRWEPRLPGTQDEVLSPQSMGQLVNRAYSISSPILHDGQLVDLTTMADVEFYIALVREARTPPVLTPRLFMLEPGDRLHLGRKCCGNYTLRYVRPSDDVLFIATGTGEAPHNAMINQLLLRGHRGRIASVVCTRHKRDQGYLKTHRGLETRFPGYRYLTLTTREPENLNDGLPGFVGKRYLQDYFRSGELANDADLSLRPHHTHVYLCGNPAMIGTSRNIVGRPNAPVGMIELLERRGFVVDRPRQPGSIHFERYW